MSKCFRLQFFTFLLLLKFISLFGTRTTKIYTKSKVIFERKEKKNVGSFGKQKSK